MIIAGPCSAETEEQIMETARGLAAAGVKIFRAGVWKPRTKPGGFEGGGEACLEWLKRVKQELGMLTAVEVATEKHVKAALTAEVAALKTQLAEANDKYLRMLAEYDNFRRRSVKEKQGVWSDAVAQTLKDLLPIADNLDRAAHATGDAEAIRQGLDMTLKAMTEMFARLGVEVYGKVGEPFDPTYHNAVMHIDDEAFGENVIAEVFQVGYRIGEKVIRFAMVKVAN